MSQFKRGDHVRIPKGTPIVYATSPPSATRPTVVRRTTAVVVDQMGTPVPGKPDTIWWGGSGGYWRVVEVTPELLAANGGDA